MLGLSRAFAALLAGVLVGVLLLAGTPSQAAVIGVENSSAPNNMSPGNGFYGKLVPIGGPYLVGSDGEAAFDPCGAGFDTSDCLNFSSVAGIFTWTQAAGSIWTSLGNQTWVLPADLTGIGCGTENEPTCEPVGHWISPNPWVAGNIGVWTIQEADGTISDVIRTFNNAAGANVLFCSDPSVGACPEPAAIAVLGVGLLGLLGVRRYRT